MFCLCFLVIYFFIILTILPDQLSQHLKVRSCSVSRTMVVDERPKVSFSNSQGTFSWQPIFVGCIGDVHRIGFACDSLDGGVQEVQVLRWMQANQLTDQLAQTVRGTAGRATDRLCLASSSY